MFIYLKGIYYNTTQIFSAEKIGKTITVEIVNRRKETFTYDNTETAGNEFKKIIGNNFIYLKGIYYNTAHILSAEKIGKTVKVEFVNGKTETFIYNDTETAGTEFSKIIGKVE